MTVQNEPPTEQKRLLKEAVDGLLADPAFLYRLKKELDRFIIGEDENKLTLWIIAASSHTKFNLSAVVNGGSSSGKSWLKSKVLQYFGNVKSFHRVTKAALDRLGTDLTNVILDIEELRGSEAAQPTLRVALSEGKLCLLSTTRDEDGHICTEEVKIEGTPTFITTCTTTNIDDELLNRLFMISIDESVKHTKEIIKFEAEKYHLLGASSDEDSEKPDNIFCEIIKELQPITRIEIPYLNFLADKFPQPSGLEQSNGPRRDFKKLIYLIGVVAWLHQKQRTIISKTGVLNRAVLASPIDFQLVWTLCRDSFLSTLYRLTKRHEEVLALFKPEDVKATASVAADLGISEDRTRVFLRGLVRRGYLSENDSQKTHTFTLKQEKKLDSSIDEMTACLTRFEEKDIENWLNRYQYKIVYSPLSPPKAINPLTGEPLDSVYTIITQGQTEPKEASKIETMPSDGVKTPILTLSSSNESALESLASRTQRLDRLTVDVQDTCFLCGLHGLMAWQATDHEGSWACLCKKCGDKLSEKRHPSSPFTRAPPLIGDLRVLCKDCIQKHNISVR